MPPENSVQPMAEVVPPKKPQPPVCGPYFNLVKQIRRCAPVREHCSDKYFKRQGRAESSLRRILNSYFDYYHRSRTHLSLEKDSPGATSDSGATNGVRRGGAAGSRKSLPKIASRSRSRKRGSWAKGNASCLLCGPLRGRMSGHIEMQDEASVMGQHQKHVKYLEADRRHREEVD